jgi:hypothetical protein
VLLLRMIDAQSPAACPLPTMLQLAYAILNR